MGPRWDSLGKILRDSQDQVWAVIRRHFELAAWSERGRKMKLGGRRAPEWNWNLGWRREACDNLDIQSQVLSSQRMYQSTQLKCYWKPRLKERFLYLCYPVSRWGGALCPLLPYFTHSPWVTLFILTLSVIFHTLRTLPPNLYFQPCFWNWGEYIQLPYGWICPLKFSMV